MRLLTLLLAAGLFLPELLSANPTAPDAPIFSDRAVVHPVTARYGMVATQEALATRAGLAVLEEGGNAIDAAVTVGFTLAVTLPRAGNLGGGGFMLIHDAARGETVALDYRESAPAAASRDMFLDDEGNADPQLSRFSHLAVGVPGTVRGLAAAHARYGSVPLARTLAPAIALARDGFRVSTEMATSLRQARDRLVGSPAARRVFFNKDGSTLRAGQMLTQPELANTLQAIADEGPDAFYTGVLAARLVTDMQVNDGLISFDDLAGYQPVWREPVRGTYRGYEIASMPPPSSGGVHLVQMLNMLAPEDLASLGPQTAAHIHLLSEVMKRAYADRAKHLGDPDFVDVPVAGLTSPAYAASLREGINREAPTPSSEIAAGDPRAFMESDETTHFSVIDENGNAVSNTYTLNFSYGTGHMVPGLGYLLNNEMDDFSAKPGVPNAYGLIGGEANAVAPGKRMLSSMTPTLVLRDGDVFLATGSPGGSRIITTTLQLISNVIDFDMNIAQATLAPRVHHQWLPDELRIEQPLNHDTRRLLEAMGHNVVERDAMGSTQSILVRDGLFYGASDPRRRGALTLGID